MRVLQAVGALCAALTLAPVGLAKKASRSLVASPGDTAILPGWHLQSTLQASNDLNALSQPGVDVSKWVRTGSRATVMAGLIENGVYNETDLFYSNNLQTKVDRSVFDHPWLYREEFILEKIPSGNNFILKTHGITSRADIYLNGALIAHNSAQAGSYGGHNYDVTQHLRPGANALLIQAHPTNFRRDLAIGFIDWSPNAPDNGTGVWRDVELSQTGPVSISPPRILTDLRDPAAKSVRITVKADLVNHDSKPVRGMIKGAIEAENGSQRVPVTQSFILNSNEEKTIEVTVELKNPKIWWPASWGEQPLYTLRLDVTTGRGELSDKIKLHHFGIRYVTSHINSHDDIEFRINGHRFLVLGAGYSSDLFLRFDLERVRTMFQYMLDMGMNTVRLEGKQEHPELYDLADRMGLMVIAGWECCDKWEAWPYNPDADGIKWQGPDYLIANASILHEAQMMQTHPSLLGFLVGSDFWPDDRATKIFVDGFYRMDWPNPIIASASKRGYPELLGSSGMKMEGPYDWVPPNYWYANKAGAAFGFGSELGPGVGTPELGSLKQFLSIQDLHDLWTNPNQGLYHMSTAASQFHNRSIYNDALFERYGKPRNLEEYLQQAQIMDYEAARAEFEGFSVRQNDSRPATGMIYWMLNAAWPNLHWQLFDYYLRPMGSYFGTKVGARLEHVAYNYPERQVYLINHSLGATGKRIVAASLTNLHGRIISHNEVTIDTVPNSSKQVLAVQGIEKIRDVGFLRLTLQDQVSGKILSRNVYWLSSHDDVLDWDDSNWYTTPVSTFTNYNALKRLPPAKVTGTLSRLPSGVLGQTRVKIVVENQAMVPAFFIRLVVVDRWTREGVAPVYWSDNYITLLPKERIELTVGFDGDLWTKEVEISGGNSATIVLHG